MQKENIGLRDSLARDFHRLAGDRSLTRIVIWHETLQWHSGNDTATLRSYADFWATAAKWLQSTALCIIVAGIPGDQVWERPPSRQSEDPQPRRWLPDSITLRELEAITPIHIRHWMNEYDIYLPAEREQKLNHWVRRAEYSMAEAEKILINMVNDHREALSQMHSRRAT